MGTKRIRKWIHNMSKSKIYQIFSQIKQRCINPKNRMYKWYGIRWIRCEWKNFKDFYRDMWSTYKEWLSIDRINNNWNYCKENCRRATRKEQGNNKRGNRCFEYNWLNHNMLDWSKILWINYRTLIQRFYIYKRHINRVLSTSTIH